MDSKSIINGNVEMQRLDLHHHKIENELRNLEISRIFSGKSMLAIYANENRLIHIYSFSNTLKHVVRNLFLSHNFELRYG